MPDLRRQRRVVYHTKIRLRSLEREKSVVARVQNLSTTGVFVTTTASDLPAAGSEVLCRMLVAGERCTFKGLVAWVRSEGADGSRDGGPGAGIEFIDLSDRETALLARLIQPDVSDRQPVDVWFEGMGSPIKSHATITDDALSISTKLPFLRLNSPVKVNFVRRGVEETRSGILEAVTLEPSAEDGIPRLQLTVSTPLADSAYGTIEVPPSSPGFTPPEGMLVREPGPPGEPAGAPLLEPPPAVVVDPAVSPVVKPQLVEQDRTPRVHLPAEVNTLVPPPPVLTLPKREVGVGTRLAMGLATVGVASLLGYLLVNRDQAPPPRGAPPVAAETRTADPPARAPLAGSAAAARPEPENEPEQEKQLEAPAATAQATPAPEAPAPPETAPAPSSERPTMAIALVGSPRGMQFYKLAEPPGVVINLPHAIPRPGSTRKIPGAPFKRLAVRRKGGGSQLRLYFHGDQHADVTAEGQGLRVTVRAARAARKS
jgi:hypothetical protein